MMTLLLIIAFVIFIGLAFSYIRCIFTVSARYNSVSRSVHGYCPSCRYDLAGSLKATCPECGYTYTDAEYKRLNRIAPYLIGARQHKLK